MKTGVRVVFWDLGGVILRTGDQAPRRAWEKRLGLTDGQLPGIVFDGPASRAAMLGQASADEVWASVGASLRLSPDDLARLRADFFASDVIDGDLIGFIRRIGRQLRCGMISNAWIEVSRLLESPWGIADAFDPLVLSAEVGLAKPDPRIFHLALARAGVEPGEAIFVDDFAENVQAAAALGLQGVLFRNRDQAEADVEEMIGSQ